MSVSLSVVWDGTGLGRKIKKKKKEEDNNCGKKTLKALKIQLKPPCGSLSICLGKRSHNTSCIIKERFSEQIPEIMMGLEM